jgi:hypothetical protein
MTAKRASQLKSPRHNVHKRWRRRRRRQHMISTISGESKQIPRAWGFRCSSRDRDLQQAYGAAESTRLSTLEASLSNRSKQLAPTSQPGRGLRPKPQSPVNSCRLPKTGFARSAMTTAAATNRQDPFPKSWLYPNRSILVASRVKTVRIRLPRCPIQDDGTRR